MDSIRLKFRYNLPNTFYFKEKIQQKELGVYGKRFVFTNNTWRKEVIKRERYCSKYWIEQDFIYPKITFLVIEFSVGKLINGENLTPIKETDLPRMTDKLMEFFNQIGLCITRKDILNSIPLLVAVGKNINITDLCYADTAIKAISMFDDRFRSERNLNLKKCNQGCSINFNNRQSTFKIYNKIKELQNNAKTKQEKNIVNKIKSEEWIIEAIRLETTLKTKQAIKQKFKNLINGEPTLEKIFKEDLWLELIQDEVKNIYNQPIKNFVFFSK